MDEKTNHSNMEREKNKYKKKEKKKNRNTQITAGSEGKTLNRFFEDDLYLEVVIFPRSPSGGGEGGLPTDIHTTTLTKHRRRPYL